MRIRVILILNIFLTITFSAHSISWKLEKNKDGVKVYTRSSEGTEVLEFKALATVKAPRLRVAEVIARITDYPNWFPDCAEARVLESISSTQRKVYYRLDLPWPTSDRDAAMLLRVDVDEDKHQTTIFFSKTSGADVVDGVVRMPAADGFWKLTSNGSYTDLHYQFLADPGGSLPAWVINMFIVDGPYDAIMALKKKLE